MARFDKSGAKGQKHDAAVAARPKRSSTMAPSIEDTMFFPRLRRHAKWMFVFLALVFGFGFVLFGVGAGGVGVGDIFRENGGGEAQSVSDAIKETQQNPNSAQAWRDLSTALQTDGQTDRAVNALVQVTKLQPRNPDAYRELGALYISQANEKQTEAQRQQLRAAYAGASQNFLGLLAVNGRVLIGDPIGRSVNLVATSELTRLSQEAGNAAANALAAYRRVAQLQPNDPNVQIELAQAAEQTGDAAAAIAAYKRFLALAPDDPTAVSVKDRVEQLKQALAGSSG